MKEERKQTVGTNKMVWKHKGKQTKYTKRCREDRNEKETQTEGKKLK